MRMAFRIHDSVVRGEIDNREKGAVRGRVWVHGRSEPVILQLAGNAHPDLAGCLLKFENPLKTTPHPTLDSLHPLQRGTIGDLTASRRVRVFDLPLEEAMAMIRLGEKPPEHMANSLYLEWFSEANGRVVIESADYQLDISPPLWRLTPEEEIQRAEAAAAGFAGFMEKLTEAVEEARFTAPDDRPMNEFDWEKAFRESDALTDKVIELQQKYGDDPDFEEILAREMGWDDTGAEDPAPGQEAEWGVDEANRICAEAESLEPNPSTEGVDWVRDDRGEIRHPLELRIHDAGLAMWDWCEQRGLLGNEGDADLEGMIFQFQSCGAKCAGVLGGLAYEEEVREPGFIVAGLKRALALLNGSLEATGRVESKRLLPGETLGPFRKELFSVREEIMALMQRFREEAE
jgi:hypothetical protein